jgi:hypothetical protein
MVDPRLNANARVDEAHHRVPPPGFKYLVTEVMALKVLMTFDFRCHPNLVGKDPDGVYETNGSIAQYRVLLERSGVRHHKPAPRIIRRILKELDSGILRMVKSISFAMQNRPCRLLLG